MSRPVVRAAIFGLAAFAVAAALRREDRKPLRTPRLPAHRRQFDNLILGAGSLLAAQVVQRQLLAPLLEADAGRCGAVRLLPASIRPVAAFLALDWAMYWWHRATHRVPLLWRLHRVHHVDLDLDMSTAIRFHALDQLVSAPTRAAMILFVGPDARTHARWNLFFFASVLFHHANVRLPRGLEERLAWVLTTPRMHGIHHMARRDATDSNWTSGLSFWDRLHGSFRMDLNDEALPIGVPGYPDQLGVAASLALPAAPSADDWSSRRSASNM